jgi:hypothetical protein
MPFFQTDEQLQDQKHRILQATWEQFPQLAKNQIAFSWVVYDPPIPVNTGGALNPETFWNQPVRGVHYRGEERIYPASVVKIFYMVAVYEWLQNGMIQSSPELERAVRDAIVDSSNDATGLMVDMLTGTTSGPELPPGPFETWKQQRNLVNNYFQSFQWEEFETININQKTWGDGPYGRERQFVGELMENRNMLTTNATTRLLHAIIGGVAVSSQASQEMMRLMRRSLNPADLDANPENQVRGFLGGGLTENIAGIKLWSKAGLTSSVRHDAAYIEIPGYRPYLLVVFTEGKKNSQSEEILPFVSQQFVEATKSLGEITGDGLVHS